MSLKNIFYKSAAFKCIVFFLVSLLFTQAYKAQIDQNIETKFRLAQSYEQAGQFSKAEEIYREIYKEQSWNNQLYDPLNRVLIAQKKYSESVELLQSKIKQSPADLNLYGLLGVTYYMMDKSKNAEEAWEKGIATNPSSYISYRVMANYAIESRAFEIAITLLNRGKKVTPDPTIFSMDIANLCIINMKFEEAAVEFCDLLELHPEQLDAVKLRINNYLSKPDALKETIKVINNAIDANPKLELYDLLTFIYLASNNYEEAFSNVITLGKKYNTNGKYIFSLAQESFRNQKYEWASKAYNETIKTYSTSPYFQTAKIGYAKTLEAALDQKYFQQNESWKPLILPQLSFINEYKKIISVYEELMNELSGNANNFEVLFRIANIYSNRISENQKAIEYYKKVIQLSPHTIFATQSYISLGKIMILENDIESAKEFFTLALRSTAIEPNYQSQATYYLACIEFWKGNFSSSIDILKSISRNSMTDYTNDALELSALISTTKKDSLNLLQYAKADLLLLQNKYKEAGTELKALSDNNNLFIINDFAKIKFAELLIAENNYSDAIKLLEDLNKSKNTLIFADKSTFLLAQCYQYGINNIQKSVEIYQKLLETFPNSLYFDCTREALIGIQTKNGQK